MGRNRYFTPAQAIEYGIIDRIVRPQEEVRLLVFAPACVRARFSLARSCTKDVTKSKVWKGLGKACSVLVSSLCEWPKTGTMSTLGISLLRSTSISAQASFGPRAAVCRCMCMHRPCVLLCAAACACLCPACCSVMLHVHAYTATQSVCDLCWQVRGAGQDGEEELRGHAAEGAGAAAAARRRWARRGQRLLNQ